MWKSAWIVSMLLAWALTAGAQNDVVIESFGPAGQITFTKVTNATHYRVEWSSAAGTSWTNFASAALSLDAIVSPGLGVVTASVPMLYRVVATVTNPPLADFTVSNSGASAYLINGDSNPTLHLIRGETYVIEVNASGHPFWIKTAATTGTGNQYNDGVTENGTAIGEIVFSVPMDAPDTLYYICQFHGAMQGVINITGSGVPENMVLIPAGTFMMGNATNVFPSSESSSDELPQHTVNMSAFYMDMYEVTKALWDEVKAYNGGNGYGYSNTGLGKATNHPVHTVNWFDVVKWCNARSQFDGLTPVYYTDAGFATVYKTGEIAPFANWAANGYRLPTEAEWEKAARGGAADTRFPWTDYTNKISWAKANYYGRSSIFSYDLDGGSGAYHPTFATGGTPYTSPVGYFAPNEYGLYDMAGNVLEWCWDWYQSNYYASSPASDPRGPAGPLLYRVMRGGSWGSFAVVARVALRRNYGPDFDLNLIGFRCARGL